MKTPDIKYKWGSEKFYGFYEPLAFRYADLVQANFLPAPKHPLVTRTNKKLFSTVEYDNYILLQGIAMQEHRRKYLSICGTYKVNTDTYYTGIDPVNPVINESPMDPNTKYYLVPYSYSPYKAYQHTDGKIYKVTLQDINIVITPLDDDIGYAIYGIRGFLLSRSTDFEDTSYFREAAMASPVYAFYREGSEQETLISPLLTYVTPPASSGLSPFILKGINSFKERAAQLSKELFAGSPYERTDPTAFLYIGQAYTPEEGEEAYKVIKLVSTASNIIRISNQEISLELASKEGRICNRLLSLEYYDGAPHFYNSNFSGVPEEFHGTKVSDSYALSLDIFAPKPPVIEELWANTETT